MAFGTKGEETMACGGLLKENRLHAEPFLGVSIVNVIVVNEEVVHGLRISRTGTRSLNIICHEK